MDDTVVASGSKDSSVDSGFQQEDEKVADKANETATAAKDDDDDLPYVCGWCTSLFATEDDCRTHIETKHAEVTQENESEAVENEQAEQVDTELSVSNSSISKSPISKLNAARSPRGRGSRGRVHRLKSPDRVFHASIDRQKRKSEDDLTPVRRNPRRSTTSQSKSYVDEDPEPIPEPVPEQPVQRPHRPYFRTATSLTNYNQANLQPNNMYVSQGNSSGIAYQPNDMTDEPEMLIPEPIITIQEAPVPVTITPITTVTPISPSVPVTITPTGSVTPSQGTVPVNSRVVAGTKKVQITCGVCGARFYHQKTLVRHKQMQHGEKDPLGLYQPATVHMFKCDVCGAKFNTKKSLYDHVQAQHTVQQSIICFTCNQNFATYKLLWDHVVSMNHHAGWYCFTCDQRFRADVDLRVHTCPLTTSETSDKCLQKRAEEGMLICPACSQVFFGQTIYAKHVSQCEFKESCEHCDERFGKFQDVLSHARECGQTILS